jgi:tetratricopeptide (TPR) repeat protein
MNMDKLSNNLLKDLTTKDLTTEDIVRLNEIIENQRYLEETVCATAAEQLAEELNARGYRFTKEEFIDRAQSVLGAQELHDFIENLNIDSIEDKYDDFSWQAFIELWSRWLPDTPSLEALDDSMQRGYDLEGDGDDEGAFKEWSNTWELFKQLAIKENFDTIGDFDQRFSGMQFVSNWIQDYADLLHNRVSNDAHRREESISFLKDALAFPVALDDLTRKNFTGALAGALIGAGDIAGGDAMFEEAISADPSFAWNYIWWSDEYYLFTYRDNKDYTKALSILKRALDANITDRWSKEAVYERLEELLEKSGIEFEYQIDLPDETPDSGIALEDIADLLAGEIPADSFPDYENPKQPDRKKLSQKSTQTRQKIGRNEPCPCGSGKKYKKCCGSPSLPMNLPSTESPARISNQSGNRL